MRISDIASLLAEYDNRWFKHPMRYFADPEDLGKVRNFKKNLPAAATDRELTNEEEYQLLCILAARNTRFEQESESILSRMLKTINLEKARQHVSYTTSVPINLVTQHYIQACMTALKGEQALTDSFQCKDTLNLILRNSLYANTLLARINAGNAWDFFKQGWNYDALSGVMREFELIDNLNKFNDSYQTARPVDDGIDYTEIQHEFGVRLPQLDRLNVKELEDLKKEFTKRHRVLAVDCHPDKMRSTATPEELERASTKIRKINDLKDVLFTRIDALIEEKAKGASAAPSTHASGVGLSSMPEIIPSDNIGTDIQVYDGRRTIVPQQSVNFGSLLLTSLALGIAPPGQQRNYGAGFNRSEPTGYLTNTPAYN
jgi:hypothetical protein